MKVHNFWDVMLHHSVHRSQCFKSTMIFETWELFLQWHNANQNRNWILHNSRLHTVPHVNIQWRSQINAKLNKCMRQISSWETKSSSASPQIPHILWYPMVHYCIHKHLPPFPILSLVNPIHACPSHFLQICFNIFLSPMPRSSN